MMRQMGGGAEGLPDMENLQGPEDEEDSDDSDDEGRILTRKTLRQTFYNNCHFVPFTPPLLSLHYHFVKKGKIPLLPC